MSHISSLTKIWGDIKKNEWAGYITGKKRFCETGVLTSYAVTFVHIWINVVLRHVKVMDVKNV